MIELWHEWNSVHSLKVRVVLEEKGLQWADRRIELLRFEHLSPAYLRLNPNGVVPTLVHDGNAVLESSIICEYLEDAFAQPPLFPATAFERARARSWLRYFDDMVHPAVRKASFELLYRPHLARIPPAELQRLLQAHPDPKRARTFMEAASGPVDQEAVENAVRSFGAIVLRIDRALQSSAWLGGSGFGIADAAMAPFVERLEVLRMEHLWNSTRARDWARNVLLRPSVIKSRAPEPYRLLLPLTSAAAEPARSTGRRSAEPRAPRRR